MMLNYLAIVISATLGANTPQQASLDLPTHLHLEHDFDSAKEEEFPQFLALETSSLQEKQEEEEEEEPGESETQGGARIGAFIPTSADVEKLSAMMAGGLFYFTDFVDENNKWRLEFALDLALRDEGSIESRLYMFRGGVAYRASEASTESPISSYIVGGVGYATERIDLGPGEDLTANAVLFNIGVLVRYNRFDARLDYFAFAGSDNTTGAAYLTVGLWF